MAKCPLCGAKIEELDYQSKETLWGNYTLSWEFNERGGDIDELSFSCPECDAELFTAQCDADEFLRQDKKKKAEGGR